MNEDDQKWLIKMPEDTVAGPNEIYSGRNDVDL